MALINPQTPVITGTAPTYSTSSASDTVKWTGGKLTLIARNTSGSPNTVTIVVPGTKYGQAIPDVPVTVPATTGERWIGPLAEDMADPVTKLITITNSAPAAGTTMAVIRG